MPKSTRDFPDRLEFACTTEMRIRLMAISFLTGGGRSYARVARNLLTQAIESAVSKLEPERRKAYDEILSNVKVAETGGRRKRSRA